jgi:hypothetical protein
MPIEIKLVWLDAVRTRVHRALAGRTRLRSEELRFLAILLGHAMDSLDRPIRPF